MNPSWYFVNDISHLIGILTRLRYSKCFSATELLEMPDNPYFDNQDIAHVT
jgi:hypothetical protein